MTDKERIEDLERRVRELEARPQTVFVPYPYPVYPIPSYYPYNPPTYIPPMTW